MSRTFTCPFSGIIAVLIEGKRRFEGDGRSRMVEAIIMPILIHEVIVIVAIIYGHVIVVVVVIWPLKAITWAFSTMPTWVIILLLLLTHLLRHELISIIVAVRETILHGKAIITVSWRLIVIVTVIIIVVVAVIVMAVVVTVVVISIVHGPKSSTITTIKPIIVVIIMVVVHEVVQVRIRIG